MSEGNIENIAKSDNNFALTFVNHHLLPDINLNGHCLIENISILKKVINLHVSYTINPQLRNLKTDFALGNYLFRSVRVTKNVDLDNSLHIFIYIIYYLHIFLSCVNIH